MSYFSHHPEAWEEICIKAICDRLLKEADLDATEEQYEFLKMVVDSLYVARVPVKPGSFNQYLNVTDALLTWSHDEIMGQERRFWNHMVP